MSPERSSSRPLRLRDAETGQLVAVPGSRSRLLRVLVAAEPDGLLATLRAALTADLIRRVVELRGGQARVVSTTALPDLLAYNVHPAGPARPDGVVDVVVGRVGQGRVGSEGLSLRIGPVADPSPDGTASLAVRLLLLEQRYDDAVRLEPEGVASAERRLRRWRDLVAAWAGFSSAAMPEAYLGTMLDRAEDDLDMRGVLGLLDRLALDDDVAPGGRFEFFLYADRLLGLDLAAHLSS